MPPTNSQNIMVGTHTVKANITPEMVSELRNTDFYVKKDLVKPVDNKIITIKECPHKNHYEVHVNYVYFDRLMKLNKIMNRDTYKETLDLVELCEQNRKNWFGVAEDDMVEEIAQDINKQILRDLMTGKKWEK